MTAGDTKLSRCGGLMCNFFFVRLINELKLWVRLSQGVLARGGDVAAASEVKCLEIQTSSCYFHHAGVCDVVAVCEVKCLEI